MGTTGTACSRLPFPRSITRQSPAELSKLFLNIFCRFINDLAFFCIVPFGLLYLGVGIYDLIPLGCLEFVLVLVY